MKKEMNYKVPEGYFEDLRAKLSAIPAQRPAKVSAVSRFTPYLALAACFAAAIVIGTGILTRTATPAVSEDEIIEYLVQSDLSLAQIENYLTLNE